MHGMMRVSLFFPCTMVIFLAASAFAQQYYEAIDAQYVTSSRHPDVLQYVICLEGEVGSQPRNLSISDALIVAAANCRAFGNRLPRIAGEPSASEIHDMIRECGFRPGDASPDMGCGSGGHGTGTHAGGPASVFPVDAGSWGGVVRTGPGMHHQRMTSLAEGEPVTLLENSGVFMGDYPWFRIRYRGGQVGYQWGGILCSTTTQVAGLHSPCAAMPGSGVPTAGGGRASTASDLADAISGSVWLYRWRGSSFEFRFGRSGELELLQSWRGTRWHASSPDTVVFEAASGARMVLTFNGASQFSTTDWDGQPASGDRRW